MSASSGRYAGRSPEGAAVDGASSRAAIAGRTGSEAGGRPARYPGVRQRGFTFLEAAFVLAIAAVIAAVAIPSYRSYQQRQELRQAAEALVQDLRNARELSVGSPQPIFISFRGTPAAWCWGVDAGRPCECSGTIKGVCKIGGADRSSFPDISLSDAQDVEITARLAQVARGGGATLRNQQGQHLTVRISPLGHVSVCGPDSAGAKPC